MLEKETIQDFNGFYIPFFIGDEDKIGHWILIVVNVKRVTIEIFDSLRNDEGVRYGNLIEEYINDTKLFGKRFYFEKSFIIKMNSQTDMTAEFFLVSV